MDDIPKTFSGEIENIRLSHCNNDIEITNLNKNTKVQGYIEIRVGKKIMIKPKKNYRISIIPFQIDTTVMHKPEKGKRTKLGTAGKEQKPKEKLQKDITLFPNPVETEFTIQTTEAIVNYKIINTFGEIFIEGERPDSNKIKVNTLQKGLYNLIMQIDKHTITKTFYKK